MQSDWGCSLCSCVMNITQTTRINVRVEKVKYHTIYVIYAMSLRLRDSFYFQWVRIIIGLSGERRFTWAQCRLFHLSVSQSQTSRAWNCMQIAHIICVYVLGCHSAYSWPKIYSRTSPENSHKLQVTKYAPSRHSTNLTSNWLIFTLATIFDLNKSSYEPPHREHTIWRRASLLP